MIVTLNVPPEIEAGLLAQAQDSGMTVEACVLSVTEGAMLSATQQKLFAEEWAAALRTWIEGSAPLRLSSLSDYAVSRESIYEGRDS